MGQLASIAAAFQGIAIQPAQRLQAQAVIRSNNDVDLIASLQSRLTQTIGRMPDRQAVAPAADRLRVPSAVHGHP
jgi:hypothetical protein